MTVEEIWKVGVMQAWQENETVEIVFVLYESMKR